MTRILDRYIEETPKTQINTKPANQLYFEMYCCDSYWDKFSWNY